MLWNGKGEKSGIFMNSITESQEQTSLLRHQDWMGTCKAELHVNMLPWMMLVFQDKVGHGAVAVFSEETQQQTAEKSLQQISIKKTGLIKHCHINFFSTLLKHNPRLRKSLRSILRTYRYCSRNPRTLNIPLTQKHKKNEKKKIRSITFKMCFVL